MKALLWWFIRRIDGTASQRAWCKRRCSTFNASRDTLRNLYRVEARCEKLDSSQGNQISETSHEKWNHVAASPLQDVANYFCNEHASDRSGHSSHSDHRGDRVRRKVV